jgi:hypothetical protein
VSRELRHRQAADVAQGSLWNSKIHTFASELSGASFDEVEVHCRLHAVRRRLRLAQKSKTAAPARMPTTLASTMVTTTPAARPLELFEAVPSGDGDGALLAAAVPSDPVPALALLPTAPAVSVATEHLL